MDIINKVTPSRISTITSLPDSDDNTPISSYSSPINTFDKKLTIKDTEDINKPKIVFAANKNLFKKFQQQQQQQSPASP